MICIECRSAVLTESFVLQPIDIQLSWDPLFKNVDPLPHCVRLQTYLEQPSFKDETPVDVLSFINPARENDMADHPIAVIFILESLRRAKVLEKNDDGQAAQLFDDTVALLPTLTEPWRAKFQADIFDLRSLPTERNVLVAEKWAETVLATAEGYLSGELGKELGEEGLSPWEESRMFDAPQPDLVGRGLDGGWP